MLCCIKNNKTTTNQPTKPCRSSLGIPQCAAIMGSCTAGAAYVPAMSDESIIVDKTGTVFLGGPPLVKAAIGETVTAEELGGARVHCEISGLTDYFCRDDMHAIETMRGIIDQIQIDKENHRDPVLTRPKPCEDLDRVDPSQDPRALIHSVVEGFQEFKERYDGDSIITGYGRNGGRSVGIISVNGSKLTARAMSKASHFVQLCDKRGVPLIFFTIGDFTAAGMNHEIIKAGARLGMAVACTKIPKITFNVGPIIGWSSIFFASRSFEPTFMYSWPKSFVSIEKGGDSDEGAIPALKGTARLNDDGIVLPRDTPVVLFDSLSIALSNASVKAGIGALDVAYGISDSNKTFGVFRM